MKYIQENKQDIIILRVQDDIPWSREDGFREILSSLTEQGPCYIVVELSGLSYADIYILTCLVWAKKRALRVGGDLVLAARSSPIHTILRLTALDRLFKSFSNEEEAIQSLRAQRHPGPQIGKVAQTPRPLSAVAS